LKIANRQHDHYHRVMQKSYKTLLVAGVALMTIGNAAAADSKLGLTTDNKLTPCPSSPNCVSSDMTDSHSIAALDLAGDANEAWQALLAYLETQPRVTIKVSESSYLRAEFRTRLLRFVDDVEFHLRVDENQIAMRSASRLGYSDLGANRRRLESVRQALSAAGVVKPGN
jgi:uncharacterized protein (DUF1499 family)